MGVAQAARGGLKELKEFLRQSALMKSMPEKKEITSWHGTPYKFAPTETNPLGKFEDKKINSGEGAQAFTYGHYTAGDRRIAEGYREALARRKNPGINNGFASRGQLAKIEPDIAHVPTLRFNTIDASSPGYWLGKNPDKRLDAMNRNPEWVQSTIAKDPAALDALGDPRVAGGLRQVAESKDRRAWLPPDVIDVIRNDVAGTQRFNSAEKIRRALPEIDPETYRAIRASVVNPHRLPGTQPAPGEINPTTWNLANGFDPNNLEYNKWGSAVYGGDGRRTINNNLAGRLRDSPLAQAALAREAGISNPKLIGGIMGDEFGGMGREYNAYKSVLGRNGLLKLGERLQDPAELQRIRDMLNMPDAPRGSLYEVLQKMDPKDLWFLDTPLIGQTDEFIKNFQAAGKALTPDFGLHQSLGQTGHNNYEWLKHQPKGFNSMPHTNRRNAEITDKMLEADIPGTMFLKGGNRDLDRVLAKPFDETDYNFVTYDPNVMDIKNSYKKGGLVQMRDCNCG